MAAGSVQLLDCIQSWLRIEYMNSNCFDDIFLVPSMLARWESMGVLRIDIR